MNPTPPYRPDSPKNGDILLVMPGPETPRSRSLQEQLVPVRRLEHIFDAITVLGAHTPANGPPCRAVILTAAAIGAAPAGAAQALRMVDPGVAIVGLGTRNGRDSITDLDAELPEDASAASILGALGLRSSAGANAVKGEVGDAGRQTDPAEQAGWSPPPPPTPAPAAPSSPIQTDTLVSSAASVPRTSPASREASSSTSAPEPPTSPAPRTPPTPPATPPATPPTTHPENQPPAEDPFLHASADLLEHLLAGGGNASAHALDLLRSVTGCPNLVLDDPEESPADDHAIVADRGRCFGILRDGDRGAPPPEHWAQWLARWLSLAERLTVYRDMAYHDDLTGAWNRRYMRAFLERTLATARRVRRPVSIMLFDIDDFKRFNDAFGHMAGDEVLRETVGLMQSVVRRADRVCRIGGDEFLVIFADLDEPRSPGSHHPESVDVLISRFREQVRSARFPRLKEDAPGPITISAGIATYPWDALDSAALLRVADERLLASKLRGKNTTTAGPEEDESAE